MCADEFVCTLKLQSQTHVCRCSESVSVLFHFYLSLFGHKSLGNALSIAC